MHRTACPADLFEFTMGSSRVIEPKQSCVDSGWISWPRLHIRCHFVNWDKDSGGVDKNELCIQEARGKLTSSLIHCTDPTRKTMLT